MLLSVLVILYIRAVTCSILCTAKDSSAFDVVVFQSFVYSGTHPLLSVLILLVVQLVAKLMNFWHYQLLRCQLERLVTASHKLSTLANM
jgi:uncharacterized membrane protein